MIQNAMSSYYNPSAATTLVSIDSDEQRRIKYLADLNMIATQRHSSTDGPMAILWDMENCPVPSDVRPEDVASNIRMAIQLHPVISGPVVNFSAYGDFNGFPRRVREGCQRTGVKLIDVPNGRKDASDKAILIDMFLFVLDNKPPATIVLVSGDVDFAPALHILGQRGYTVILVIPSSVYVNSALSNAGKFVWDWHSIVHGEGFVPRCKPRVVPYLMGCNIGDNSNMDGLNEDETILYRGHLESTMWVAPGDLNGLKGQLVKLLELSGGCIPLMRVPSEYQRKFSKPLFVSDYGVAKLVDLFKKMSDVIVVDGKGNKRFVYLRNSKPNIISPSSPVVLLRRERKGKEPNGVTTNGGVSSDEMSDTGSVQSERNLEEFKFELQDILVSYCCQVQMDCFEAIYKLRYKRPLAYTNMGVNHLEQLFDKLRDVVAIHEDPATGRKLISPV
ncbi:Putative endonuclease or glycosyl hydrolase [Arabidopsis thaliana]|uniref:Endonuclease or glycosyl hydrolase n=1 Tax=Arabidopsis thaliana TaxID=3702 RepID=A0A1P8AYF6_ARATH|nr:Putative endonuclease or glycosyl hydrolase [Arabidopsis thaliana]ANM61704.1 Putative endonuclease or glycosyl hydrolase [Arabidopsis thaliana]|eukprot:NP_001323906.1 Putative endonuclease or glycosyl hydrolase [Arabidopsis thaliana]